MSLTTLAIHVEAWLQEELGAQQAILAELTRTEAAARTNDAPAMETSAQALGALLDPAGARVARRTALLTKLAAALAVSERDLSLTKLCAHLDGAGVDTQRIRRMRAELRQVATNVVVAGRRLAAVAHYQRGFFEELCRALRGGAPEGQDNLIDARG